MSGHATTTPGQVVWSDHMSVGVAELDADHVVIIDALKAVVGVLDEDRSGDEIDQRFAELMTVVSNHFTREEAVMRSTAYPGAVYHIREHVWLLSTLFDIQYNRLHATETEIRFAVREFLTTWLYGHVLEDDFAYRVHLSNHHAQVVAIFTEE